MKVLILSDPNSSHTLKWAQSLAQREISIFIFGIGKLKTDYTHEINIQVKMFETPTIRREGALLKYKYLTALPSLLKSIKNFKPDIIHAHYASSYGLLGALSRFHPLIISVWGSDVFSFPLKSLIHKKILIYTLNKADEILSTSHVMKKEASLYTKKEIKVTPFGVDLNQFTSKNVESLFSQEDIVIGTIKTLEEKYGIEYLLRAFKILNDKYPNKQLKLLIVGGGSLESHLKKLAHNLGIEKNTIFSGSVPFSDTPKYHNMLSVSVSVSVSNSESFGVAIIEASACEKPVVVSNVGGLPEVVEDKITGFIVPPKNPEATANAIDKLILDKNLREKMGKAGRERVSRLYNWEDNVQQMINIYEELLGRPNNQQDSF